MIANSLHDTIAAVSTPRGTGAIAVIRMSGKRSFEIAGKIFLSNLDFGGINSRKAVHGHIVNDAGLEGDDRKIIDEVILTKFESPNSYTGEDVVEISCHGSRYVVHEILELLMANNARLAEPGEFTKRAFLNGKMDLLQAEGVADIIAAQTRASLQLSVSQAAGKLSTKLVRLKEEIKGCCMSLELELDFAEEDVSFVDRKNLLLAIERTEKEIIALIKSFTFGKILREGVHLVIIGRPNVGKSSLLNVLLQEDRAIVTDIAGTTRDSLEEKLDIEGVLFRVTDTAGLRETQDKVEKVGVMRTEKLMENAEILVLVVDGSENLTKQDIHILNTLIDKDHRAKRKVLVAINKCDLPQKLFQRSMSTEYGLDAIEISAKTGYGMKGLERELVKMALGGHEAPMDSIIGKTRHKNALEKAERYLAAAGLSIRKNYTADLIAVDLRAALSAIGEVTGEVTNEEILQDIFSKFCIGK